MWFFYYVFCLFFFFKQKTAYEIMPSLVGSEMCIRDRPCTGRGRRPERRCFTWNAHSCLLYTSDAADDLLCVDLGGRRIIKKKTSSEVRAPGCWAGGHEHRRTQESIRRCDDGSRNARRLPSRLAPRCSC